MALFQPTRSAAASTAVPSAEQPLAERLPADWPPAERPPSEQPPAERPPFEQPPAERGKVSGYEAIRASRDFWTIRRRFRSFAGPACTLFIVWYFLFVIVAVFAPGFMRIRVFGDINVGLCFGVLEFASTFTIAAAYRHWARRRLDPLAERLRHRLEGGRGR